MFCRLCNEGVFLCLKVSPDIFLYLSITTDHILRMIDAWYREKEMYDFDGDKCTGQCGHYKVVSNSNLCEILNMHKLTHSYTQTIKPMWFKLKN